MITVIVLTLLLISVDFFLISLLMIMFSALYDPFVGMTKDERKISDTIIFIVLTLIAIGFNVLIINEIITIK